MANRDRSREPVLGAVIILAAVAALTHQAVRIFGVPWLSPQAWIEPTLLAGFESFGIVLGFWVILGGRFGLEIAVVWSAAHVLRFLSVFFELNLPLGPTMNFFLGFSEQALPFKVGIDLIPLALLIWIVIRLSAVLRRERDQSWIASLRT